MKIGDRVYYIISGRAVRPAILKRMTDRSCVLAYGSGAICLPTSRVFESEEEAEKHLIPPQTEASVGYSSYMKRRLAYDLSGKPNP